MLPMAVAALVAAGAVGYWQFAGVHAEPQPKTAATAAKAPPRVAVEIATVRSGTVTVDIDAIGTLESPDSVVLAPEVDGIIAEILFDEGQPVAQGQTLVRLDDVILRAELAQARAQLTLAEANFERADTLLRQRTGTQRTRDEAWAALQSARASVALADARLQKTVIRAPFDGILGLRSVSVGGFVSRGQALVSVQTMNPLKADFRVPETFLTALRVGQSVEVAADALAGRRFPGTVSAISPQLDVNGRALRVRALIPNPELVLRPGLFVRVSIAAAQRSDAVLVPEAAVVPEGNRRVVFRVADGRATRVPVVLGQRQGGEVEVVEGLAAGEVVVTAGHQRLREGSAVDPVTPPPEG